MEGVHGSQPVAAATRDEQRRAGKRRAETSREEARVAWVADHAVVDRRVVARVDGEREGAALEARVHADEAGVPVDGEV